MSRGFSPSKSKVLDEVTYRRQRDQTRRPTNPSINYWKYFCHYNNAIYQGGMSAYKKHGKGLLFHDDGAAVITEYLHDTPNGHNIIFRENSIASVIFKNASEYQIAYKAGKYIIKITFTQSSQKANGVGVLIDYQNFKIYQLIFKKGVLVDKILNLNQKINDDAFQRGLKHEQAFNLTFQKPETMRIKYDHNQLTIGYFDENGHIHGLAFKMYAQNLEVLGQKGLYMKLIQRGYYRQSQLQTFGQKYFSNGNKYIGQFQKGQFHGDGILVCPQQLKWVYGKFVDGKLSQVIDSNNKKHTQNDFQMWNDGLLDIHRRYRERWIQFNIELPDQLLLYNTLKDAIQKKYTQVDPDEGQVEREQSYRMNRIQQQFQSGNPGSEDRSFVEDELDKHYNIRSNKKGYDSGRSNRIKVQNTPKYYQPTQSRFQIPHKKPQEKYLSKNSGSPKIEERRAQSQYRMKDPFQIQLIKVPFEQKYTPSPKRQQYFQSRELNRKYYDNTLNYSGYSVPNQYYPQRYRSRLYYDEPYDRTRYYGAYRLPYLQILQKQRERFKELQKKDQQYLSYLRKGIQNSPVHRNYYTTPPRYDSNSIRSNGKIINKRVFNYQDPTQLYTRDSPSKTALKRYHTSRREEDDFLLNRKDEPVYYKKTSPSKNSPINHDTYSDNKTFVENNYKYWK